MAIVVNIKLLLVFLIYLNLVFKISICNKSHEPNKKQNVEDIFSHTKITADRNSVEKNELEMDVEDKKEYKKSFQGTFDANQKLRRVSEMSEFSVEELSTVSDKLTDNKRTRLIATVLREIQTPITQSQQEKFLMAKNEIHINNPWPFNTLTQKYNIPYVFTSEFTQSEQEEFLWCFKWMEFHTSIEFVERVEEPYYLNIKKGKYCFSDQGYMMTKNQSFMVNDGCLNRRNIMMELFHTLGIPYGVSRLVGAEYKYLSITDDTDISFSPYDYASIMHSWKKWEKFDIPNEFVKPYSGQFLVPSPCDWKKINELYPKGQRIISEGKPCKPYSHYHIGLCKPKAGVPDNNTNRSYCYRRCTKDICEQHTYDELVKNGKDFITKAETAKVRKIKVAKL